MRTSFELSLWPLLPFIGVFLLLFCHLLRQWTKGHSPFYHSQKVLDMMERWAPPKPNYGGILFYIAFCFGFIFSFEKGNSSHSFWLFASATVAFSLGLWDDLWRINPLQKFSGQFITAGLLIAGGHRLGIMPEPYSAIFTLLFVIALMNSINMLDNMDAVASIVALGVFTYGTISAIIFMQSDIFLPLILCISVFAFLLFNWHPSKIFMGDCGSMLLGLLMSYVLMNTEMEKSITMNNSFMVSSAISSPLLLLTLPLVDTAVVIFNRITNGVSPFKGGRDHTTHHLVYFGLPEKRVALLFMCLTTAQVALPLLMQIQKSAFEKKLNVSFESRFYNVGIVLYITLYFFAMIVISRKNLKKGKFSYPKK